MSEAPGVALKHTPLFAQHKELGARFTEFHGWEMPIQYEGILKEHLAVRSAAGLFDVSHMGQYVVEGPPAFAFIQRSIASDLARAVPGKAIYTHMLNERGGVVDDVLVYCLAPERYFMVVNAGNVEKDFDHLKRGGVPSDLMFENASDMYGMIAIQGPKAVEIVKQLAPQAGGLGHFGVLEKDFYGRSGLLARTGYTGEDGFEVIAPSEVIGRVWRELLDKGKSAGLVPCGLGARDTLRLEAGLMLYGNDLDENHSPIEAGCAWLLALDGPQFTGRDALKKQYEQGLPTRLKGFKLLEPGVPRAGCKVSFQGKPVGTLSSATFSPTLKTGIGIGYMSPFRDLSDGQTVEIEIHGKGVKAAVQPLPFYKSKTGPRHPAPKK